MLLLSIGLCLAASGPAVVGPVATAPLVADASDTLVVRGGRLFDGLGDRLRANPGIVVVRGRILVVGADADGLDLDGARTLDLADDETVLPGLVDLHAHYAVDLLGAGRVEDTVGNPVIYLANGVTTTFTAGDVEPEEMLALRHAIDAGRRTGPRVLCSGPYFGRWRRGWRDDMSLAELRAEVDHWAELGVAGFKAKGIGPRHLEALIERAHRHGRTVTGHLDSGWRDSVNPRDAIAMGIDRVEHFLGGDALAPDRSAYASLVDVEPDSDAFRRIAALFIERGVHFDATLSAYAYYGARDERIFAPGSDEGRFFTPYVRERVRARPRKVHEQFERIYHVKLRTVRAFWAAGGAHLITLGTDHPSWGEYVAGFGAHRELAALVLAGIPPADALRCGTINGARAIGLGDRIGTIEPGKLADLFVVQGDPLADIHVARQVRWVVRGGAVHDPVELLASVEGRIGPTGPDDHAAWKPR